MKKHRSKELIFNGRIRQDPLQFMSRIYPALQNHHTSSPGAHPIARVCYACNLLLCCYVLQALPEQPAGGQMPVAI